MIKKHGRQNAGGKIRIAIYFTRRQSISSYRIQALPFKITFNHVRFARFAVSKEAKTWLSLLKPRPNDRNMPTDANATCRNIVGRNMLHAFGHRVATCWLLLAQVWSWSNLSQQHPTHRNMSQHGGQTHATCCAQQCCDMLRWHVAIVWPGLTRWKYDKTIVRFGFCDIQNNQGLGKGLSASAFPTSTLIILAITKTSFNNCLKTRSSSEPRPKDANSESNEGRYFRKFTIL